MASATVTEEDGIDAAHVGANGCKRTPRAGSVFSSPSYNEVKRSNKMRMSSFSKLAAQEDPIPVAESIACAGTGYWFHRRANDVFETQEDPELLNRVLRDVKGHEARADRSSGVVILASGLEHLVATWSRLDETQRA
jgi:hypothetical protein